MSSSATAQARPELVERIGDLARETGSTPDELEAAARAWAEYERWKAAMIREALEELEADVPGIPNEEVMRWLESWGTDHELPPPEPPAKPGGMCGSSGGDGRSPTCAPCATTSPATTHRLPRAPPSASAGRSRGSPLSHSREGPVETPRRASRSSPARPTS